MDVDEETFKAALGQFVSGVTIVTTERNGEIRGLTVSAFASVSKQPPLVSVNIEKEARTDEFLREGLGFTVSILGQDQEDVCMRFAKPGLSMEKRLADTPTTDSNTPGVIIDDCLAWMSCEGWDQYEGGDHRIYVGRIVNASVPDPDRSPLIYYQGDFPSLKPAD